MPYPALVACHVLVVGLFLTGLGLAAGLLPGLTAAGAAADLTEVRRLRSLQRWMTTPALLLVWALGLTMAVEAGWFAMGWLKLKILLVLILSGLHGRQLLTLRKLARGERVAPVSRRPLAAFSVATALILVLVTAKPF